MANRLMQSLFWGSGISFLSYGLYIIFTPTQKHVADTSKVNNKNKSVLEFTIFDVSIFVELPRY